MRVVILGNGIAGVTTARTALERDASLSVTVYSEEPYPYYSRPRLVDLIGGRVTPEQIIVYSDAWYAEHHVETVLGRRAVAIHPAEHSVEFADGEKVPYDRLVLATGAHAWMPPIDGADTPGVHTLRTMEDGLAIRDGVHEGDRVLVLGGGLLGLEIASAFNGRGVDVTVVEVFPRLLPRQLDTEGAAVLQRRIERSGVHIVTGDSCGAIRPAGHGERVVLKSGHTLDVDKVIVSAGAHSNIDLPRQAGLACNRGVVVDERLLTSAEDILAVGDIAEFHGRAWGIIPAALAQARVAGARLAGDDTATYEDIVPATSLKVTGIDVTSIGEVNPETPGAIEVRSTSPDESAYTKLVVRDGRVVGAILVGSREKLRAVNALMSRGVDVSAHVEALLAPDFDLLALATA